MHKDTIASWTWPGYEGKPAVVDIYADAEEVELFLNGRSLGKKPAGEQHEFTATYEISYEPGELTAVSYEEGRETGRFSLTTAKDTIRLCAQTDKTVLRADGEDLAFITVNLEDENGIPNLSVSRKIAVSVEGAGRLEAFGSADPQSLTSYDEAEWDTYDGYVMAVIRAGTEEGKIKVVFTSQSHEEQCVELEVRKQA